MSSAGAEVIEAAELAGLYLDPWQQFVLMHGLGEREDGKWAAKEVGAVVPRQNGKGGILEARELGGLFVLGERLIIHSAHQYDTSMEAFRRLLDLIENTPEFEKRVARVIRSHGEEGIELKTRQRIRFRTRTKGGGRGFSCDCLILDEAMILSAAMHGALMPTLAARDDETVSGTQIWYTGSAVDEDVHEHGVVFSRVRDRGIAGDDPRLFFAEWSADPELYEDDPGNPEGWAQANPGLGIRIPEEHIDVEYRSMDARTFATERLGIGHWPVSDADAGRVINRESWKACQDDGLSHPARPLYAIEVTLDRERSSICAAGLGDDGLPHLEVVDNDLGTEWVVGRCVELQRTQRRTRFVVDPRSPAGALIPDLEAAKLKVHQVNTLQFTQACGALIDGIRDRRIRINPHPALDSAVTAATVRSLSGAWAWERNSLMDVTPLVAGTLAVWGAQNLKPPLPATVNLNQIAAKAVKEGRAPNRCPRCLGKYDEGGERTHFCHGQRM